MAQEWNIKPRSRACAVCGRVFSGAGAAESADGGGLAPAAGAPCVSALFQAEGGFERRDYCPGCWAGRTDGGEPFSQWQSVVAPPAAAKEEPIKRETAEALFRRLVELDDPANVNVVYILAVMLERKRRLVERDAKPRPEGGILRIYEQKSSGDTFLVVDPQLRLDAIGEVQKQVVALLG